MLEVGPIGSNSLPKVIGLMGAPKTGKTSLAAAAPRACPEWFGTKGAYFEIDPDGAGSMLHEDRASWTKYALDAGKYFVSEMLEAINHPWEKHGIGVVMFDTLSVLSEQGLSQIAQLSMFGNNVDIKGDKHASPGDYSALDKAIFKILNAQKTRTQAGGPVFISLFHENWIEPEQNKPGDSYGGPRLAGRKLTDKVVGWYNFMPRIAMRPKKRLNLSQPQEFERVLYTQNHGGWRCGIRTGDPENPIPEITITPDRAEVWKKIEGILNPKPPVSI